MGFANAYNETHQWARTITIGGAAPTAPGQFVTLTSNGWEYVDGDSVKANVGIPLKVVKSVDDLSLGDADAFVRNNDTPLDGYDKKVTVYWNDFYGITDNYGSGTFDPGTQLVINAEGKLVPLPTDAGTYTVVAVVEEGGVTDPEAEASGIVIVQVQPYSVTVT